MMLYLSSALLPLEVDDMQSAQVLRHLLVFQVEITVLLLELLIGERYFIVRVVLNADGSLVDVGLLLVFFGVGRQWYFVGKWKLMTFSVALSLIFYLM